MRTLILCVASLFSSMMIAPAAPTAARHHLWVEYKRPAIGTNGPEVLEVCFGDAVVPEVARKMLWQQMEILVASFPPKIDVMGVAWDCTGDMEKLILDWSQTPFYSAKEKKIMRYDEAHPGKK